MAPSLKSSATEKSSCIRLEQYIVVFCAQVWHLPNVRSTSAAIQDQSNSRRSLLCIRHWRVCPEIGGLCDSRRMRGTSDDDTTIRIASLMRERRTSNPSEFVLNLLVV